MVCLPAASRAAAETVSLARRSRLTVAMPPRLSLSMILRLPGSAKLTLAKAMSLVRRWSEPVGALTLNVTLARITSLAAWLAARVTPSLPLLTS